MGGQSRETLLQYELNNAKEQLKKINVTVASQRKQLARLRDTRGNTITLHPDLGLEALAIMFATNVHAGQKRDFNNQPYILHPLRVMTRAAKLELPGAVIAAAVLHDVMEDCNVSFEQLAETFGAAVAELVLELTNQEKAPGLERAERKRLDRERLKKVSTEAKIIKMIDRIDNMSDMDGAKADFMLKYAEESELLLREALTARSDEGSTVISILVIQYTEALRNLRGKAKCEILNSKVE